MEESRTDRMQAGEEHDRTDGIVRGRRCLAKLLECIGAGLLILMND